MLSVAIITFNEEANIARTLRSIAEIADEIIIVDSGSIDRTLELAREFGAKVKIYSEQWKGFAAQKNSAIEKCTGDFILSLDADEEVTPELASEILRELNEKPKVAYWIPRRNLFLGRWIRHGGFYPDAKLRLFRRGTGEFADRPVHEDVQLAAPHKAETMLRGDIVHHAYPTLANYIEHMNRYSTLGAEVAASKGRTSQNLFVFFFNVVVRPRLQFVYNYFFRRGFLDGREGFLLHWYHQTYASWKYAKAWELGRKRINY